MVREGRALVITHSASDRDSVLWRFALEQDAPFDLVVPAGGDSHETLWTNDWVAEQRVFRLGELRLSKTSHTSLLYRGLGRLLETREYDFVHVAAEPWSLLSQTLQGRIPVVVHGAETVMAEAPLPYKIRRVGARRVLRKAAGVAAWGQEALREFARLGIRDNCPRAVIPMGIPNPDQFKRGKDRGDSNGLRLLFVGRLVDEKGVLDLLDALAQDPHIAVQMRIMGSGPLSPRVHEAARSDSRIVFIGAGNADDVSAQLAWCDACVIPSQITPKWNEQWGRIAAESMLVGRPILSSNSGELPWMNPSSSLVFEAGNPGSLLQIIHHFAHLTHYERTALAAAATERARAFGPQAVYAELRQFWSEVFSNLESTRR